MNFDIEVVKQETMENPVYYVQYGHARLASILRKAAERGVTMPPIEDVDLPLLTHDAELALLRAMAEVPGVIADAAALRAPHRLTHAVQDLAARSHRFYTECRVMSDDEALTHARLWLCAGCKQVIANLLELLGVSAPESMERVNADVDG
jgi:arginyl-tRNA synthetase